MRYFGYGSNLNTADLRRWCRERGCEGAEIRELGPAWLPDHEPVFHYLSVARDGGALSVRPRLGAATPGALFEVDDAGWRALDRKEGAKYARVEVVALRGGEEVRATTYVVAEAHRRSSLVAPRAEYLALVTEALEARGFSSEQVRDAARGLTIDAFPRALFVYGTLMRGEVRERLLCQHAPRRWAPARARGRLLHLGAYPGLVDGDGEVRGELVELDDPGAALRELDDVEDFAGYGSSGSLYRRVVIDVAGEPAWTYRYLGADGAVIESGDWRSA